MVSPVHGQAQEKLAEPDPEFLRYHRQEIFQS
jgi:hypothetical protein